MFRRPFHTGRGEHSAFATGAKAAALAVSAVLVSAPQGHANAQELLMWNAVEIKYSTEAGKTYTVQGSEDLKKWSPLQEPFFGNGQTVSELVSNRQRPVDFGFYRLKVESTPEGGFAPWNFTETAFQKSASEGVERYSFNASEKGTLTRSASDIPFTWKWLRTGLNSGTLTLQRDDGFREVMELQYTGANLGRVQTETVTAAGSGPFHGSGTFGPAPALPEKLRPSLPAGRTAVFADNAGLERLKFLQYPAGRRLISAKGEMGGNQETETSFTCTWQEKGGNMAQLTVTPAAGQRVEYDLTFKTPLAGSFARRVFTGGVLRDSDEGVFSMSGEE